MKNIYRYIYILVIIFLAVAGVARATGTLNFDQATDAFVIDGKLTFNNPSRVNLFIKQLASKVTSPFYFNADKDLQFRIGQLTGDTPSYEFIVSKSDGKQLFKIDNAGNLSLGVDIVNTGSKFTIDKSGNVNVSGTTKLIGGLSGNTLNYGAGLISFSGQSLGFGITPNTPNYRWFHEGDGDNLMTLTSGGDLSGLKSITAKGFCLNEQCITSVAGWSDVKTKFFGTILDKTKADAQVLKAINIGFGGVYSNRHGDSGNCVDGNALVDGGGCGCPANYQTLSPSKVTGTSGVNDIWFCYKKNNPS